MWVGDGQRAREVLTDVGCGYTAQLRHGGEDGQALAQETLRVPISEHQDLKEPSKKYVASDYKDRTDQQGAVNISLTINQFSIMITFMLQD